MKKKVLAVIAMVVALIPTMVVRADFSAGQLVNFFQNDSEKSAYESGSNTDVGVHAFIVSKDEEKKSGENYYYKTIAMIGNNTSSVATLPGGEIDLSKVPYKDGDTNSNLLAYVRSQIKTPAAWESTSGEGVDVAVATFEDIKAVFGVSNIGDSVTLTDETKGYLDLLTAYSAMNTTYIFTSTKGTTNAKYYVAMEVTRSEGIITGAKIVEADQSVEAYTAGTVDESVFIELWFNETYTCSSTTKGYSACYKCPSSTDSSKFTYTWTKAGTQATGCEVVAKSKANCVTNGKTGVESYLIPAAIVLGVCAIVLTVVKRKDAFKAI